MMLKQYLCITIRPLGEFWHGRSEDGGVEYPPAPFRLFQALVAWAYMGAYANDQPEQKRKALKWLEQQEPPLIIAPSHRELNPLGIYVPNNDADKYPERAKRLVLKMSRPIWLGENAIFHYLWPIKETLEKGILEALQRETRRLSILGRSVDEVVSEARLLEPAELNSLEGERYYPAPDQAGIRRLRVPKAGSLDSLFALYQARLRFAESREIPDRTTLVCREIVYRTDTWNEGRQRRPFAAFALVPPQATARSEKRRAFWHTQTARVAAMARHAALESARRSNRQFPGGIERFVAGHASQGDKQPLERFSYLPLPSINHRFADGGIRRVLIVEPVGGDGKHASWAQRALNGEPLVRESDGLTLAELSSELNQADSRLLICYVKEADTWLSVTPVILPGYDDGKYHKALKLLRKALEDARIPESIVQDVRLQKAPFWPGSAHPTAYFMPGYVRHYSAWHALIKFKQPFYGPLALGVGRHIGLGLFAAADK
ncbi:MAG: type I-U CRISPR-associated protein Csb2 [Thermoflexales bacterium]